jgi:chorismate--pyruvate lyase
MPINTQSIFLLKASPSNQLLEWINYQLPLTDKLCQEKGEAHLELLTQQWQVVDLWSQRILNIQDKLGFYREILMTSHQVAYWYARSIIPKSCYDLAPDFFDRLKNESIKNLIFKEERVQRIHSVNYPISNQCIEFYWVKKYLTISSKILWVRITEYCFQKKESFYLIEIMLPALGSNSA